MTKTTERAAKNDVRDAKPRGFWLIPRRPLTLLAEVYVIGARKYAPGNWRKGFDYSQIIDACYRHLTAWAAGEERDPTDGQHHLASVAWCALTLMEMQLTHPELDDRDKEL